MSKLPLQLKKAHRGAERLSRIKAYLPTLKTRIAEKKKTISALQKQSQKEYLDVEVLKRMGLKRLFQHFLGDFEERLEQEKQEYLLAVLDVQAAESDLKGLLYQYELLKKEAKNLKGVKKELAYLLKRAEIKSLIVNSVTSEKISFLNTEVLRLNSLNGEINEANLAGNNAKKYLVKLKEAILAFDNWGKPLGLKEVRYGGKGRTSSYAKKMEVDRSKGLLFKCKGTLDRFEYELEDVSKQLQINYADHLEVIHDFLDIFLDNLITDWIVRQKIHFALTATEMVYDKILRLQQMLSHEEQKNDNAIRAFEQEKMNLLLK